MKRAAFRCAVFLALPALVPAQKPQARPPAAACLSTERLARIAPAMNRLLEEILDVQAGHRCS